MSDCVEEAINAMPPYMQRRMAKLSLAGARFMLEAYGIYSWKVLDAHGAMMGRYTHLARAINDTWMEFLWSRSAKDADMEAALEALYINELP